MSDLLLLCYHGVSESWPASLSIAPRDLAVHVDSLKRRGYEGMTLSEAADGPPGRDVVAITFDDALRSVFELALPILSEAGYRASVFAPTSFIGGEMPVSWPGVESWLETEHRDELTPMSWDELARLADAGWEVGSHTRTHPRLPQLSDPELGEELEGSRIQITERLGFECRCLAYPYGDHDPRVIAATQEAGYTAAAALPSGRLAPATGRFDLPRVYIDRSDSLRRFDAKTSKLVRRVMASRAWDGIASARRAIRR